MSDHAVAHSAGHGHQAHGHGGLGKYIAVFIALCALSTASFFTTSRHWPYHDQPSVGWAFMMAVSCTKALLVVLFFMHVKYEANWKYVLTIPASLMALFLGLALVPDIGMRVRGNFGYGYSEERMRHAAHAEDTRLLEQASRRVQAHAQGEHGAGARHPGAGQGP
jgi:cytochrome c oxidase subunit 4